MIDFTNEMYYIKNVTENVISESKIRAYKMILSFVFFFALIPTEDRNLCTVQIVFKLEFKIKMINVKLELTPAY